MHHMRIALYSEEFLDFDGAVFANATEIIAAKVHEHDVLGALLFAREHFAFEALVFGFVFAAPPRARDGAIEDVSSLDFDEHFRRTANDSHIVELKIEQIGRGIERAQLAINLKRIGLGFDGKTLAENDLKNVASADVLL